MFALVALLAVLHLSVRDNGKTFTVNPRTTVVLVLPSNASTGYRWEIGIPAHSAIRLLSHRYVQPKNSPPGAAGKEVWRFRILGPSNTTQLRLGYLRPWQPKKLARRFGVTIRVR